MPMTQQELDAFLAEPRNAIISTLNKDGSAQLTPIWFVWEDGVVYFSATKHRLKVKNLKRDPRISFLVDDPGPPQRTVVFRGEVHSIEDGLGTVTERIAQKYTPGGSGYESIANTPGRVVVAFRPSRILSWRDAADRREHVQRFK
jgi:PPOX class probable F420-dependent enzyme